MCRTVRAFFALLAMIAIPRAASAQADLLTGRVVDHDGKPVVGARVEVWSAETETTRMGMTDGSGRYMVLFPDGGARYVLRISMIGMAEFVSAVVRDGDEELLVTNATLSPQPIALAPIQVRAPAPTPGQGRAGEQSSVLSQELLNRLPLPDLDPNTLALLAAGVVSTELDSLSGRMGFSVAGMSDLLNQTTLDGLILGQNMGVPEEGVRRTQVTTSTFDVSRGGFAGGQVAMVTARGNRRISGAISYRLDDDALQVESSPTAIGFTRHNIGASIGGPVVDNRLFYNAAFQLASNVNHRFALAAGDPTGEIRSGVTQDSIARFLSILNGVHAFTTDGQTGPYDQRADDVRLQARVDWNVTQSATQSQTFSARFNVNVNDQDSTRISSLDLLQHGGEQERDSRLAAITLNSRFGTSWTNTLNLSYAESWSEGLPFLEIPEGQVRVTSTFDDRTRGTRNLVFGGNRSLPSDGYTRGLQLANDLSFLLPVGPQLHRLKVGGSIQTTRDVSRSTDNLLGTFTYNSLADFEANRPERFERTLTAIDARTGRIDAGLYIGDTWRISLPFEVTYGMRWDHTRMDERPAHNPAVEAAFGRRTDVRAQAWGLSPRIGFSYRLSGPQEPVKSLAGGIGVYAGRAPTSLFASATQQTGAAKADQRLVCIGDAVPAPAWSTYVAEPSSIPAACVGDGATSPLASLAPTVTLLDPDQRLPSSFRIELGYRAQLNRLLSGNVRYTFARGFGLWGQRDLNLDEARTMMLAEEGRPFFGDPAAIVPATGAVSLASSRRDASFGNVFEVHSELASETHQLTTTLTGLLTQNTIVMLNHTLNSTYDQGSGLAGGVGRGGFGGGLGGFAATFSRMPPTAGNPNIVEWARGSSDRRHTFNLTVSHAFASSFELSAVARLSSGAPFTPVVSGDINGDGFRNDRAFVFDPATASDPAIVASINRLLENLPGRVAQCIESQMGRIAERNSCTDAWNRALDLRANLRPDLPGLERRLTVSIDGRNILTGLDQLLHGEDDLRGWGDAGSADPTLLYVRGYDPVANRFIYEVNEGFGQALRGANAFQNPFGVTISARFMVGGQPQLSNRGFGGRAGIIVATGFEGPAGPGGGRFGGDSPDRGGMDRAGMGGMRDLLAPMMSSGAFDPAQLMVSPLPSILELSDSLGLTDTQRSRLRMVADSLDARLAVRRDAILPAIEGLRNALQSGVRPSSDLLQRTQSDVQLQLESGRGEIGQAMTEVRRVLSDAQWNRVPDELRNAVQPGGTRGARSFDAIGMVDRMLANPIPIVFELRDALALTPPQVARVDSISTALQARLDAHRATLGRRFDAASSGDQGRVFVELQPDLQRVRGEVLDALREVQRTLTADQWSRIPEAVRNPFQGFRERDMR